MIPSPQKAFPATSGDQSGTPSRTPGSRAVRRGIRLALFIILVNTCLTLWLLALGRKVYPPSGVLMFWSGDLGPGGNSQHLSDWYSFLHVSFGIALFLAVDAMKPGWHLTSKLAATVAGSGVWEAVENTPFVISLFVDPNLPGAYHGDSVVNSLGDMGFAIGGFLLASVLPVRVSLIVIAVIEVVVGVSIGDGLVLGGLRVLGVPV